MVCRKRQTDLPSDEELVRRAGGGDSAAFDDLFARHKDGVYACLWHCLGGDAELVEDAVGAVFLSAYRGLGNFRGDSSFYTWIYRIAVNQAQAQLRRKKRQWMLGWFSRQDLVESARGTDEPDPAEEVLRADTDHRLWRAVHALPEPYRTPLILRYAAEMDSPEIAAVIGRPAGTVRYQLSHGLKLLRERLERE
jgi:RNA polymerase sigma-70 factor, ECF subfamily